MKRLIVVAAIVSACGLQNPAPESALPENHVVLATFTVDVDLAAGTFVVRTTPAASGAPGGSAALVNLNTDVTVANSGSPWINQGTPTCLSGSSPTTWGAAVAVKNNLSATVLSGVYAEITSFGGGIGTESCSSATAPTGLDATRGLWSYGTIQPGATASAQNWIFKYVNATQFSFSGRIVGVKIDPANVQGGSQRSVYSSALGLNVVADNGTTILVAGGTSGVDFVDSSTGAFQQTVATSAKVNAIAVAPARIWYVTQSTTTNFIVGWMARDGTGTNSVTVTPGSGPTLRTSGGFSAIIPDPTTPNDKAWLLYQNNGNATYIWSFTITGSNAGTLGNPLTLSSTLSYSAALGSDNNLYATTQSTSNIHKVSLGADPASLVASFSTAGAACTGPFGIISSGATLHFSARLGNKVCSMTQAGVVTAGNAATTPNGLAFDSAGGLWAAINGGGLRLTNASPLDAAIPGGVAANAIKLANGYLWVTSNNALWRVTTQ